MMVINITTPKRHIWEARQRPRVLFVVLNLIIHNVVQNYTGKQTYRSLQCRIHTAGIFTLIAVILISTFG